jgi:hypothetical protein
MGVVRWRGLGPSSVLVVAALVIAALLPASIAAEPPPRPTASPCVAPSPIGAGLAEMMLQPQARVASDALLTSRGELTGRQVTVERPSAEPVVVSLPAEAFVADARGAAVVYGWHSPLQGSEVRLVDAATGCDRRLARPTEVVRSALLAPDGASIYVHRVTQSERHDLGVMRHDLVSGEQVQVVEPLPESDVFGPTFATTLGWSLADDELAVQSCGADRCRTRVLDATSGTVQTYADAGHGSLIGFDRSTLVVYDTCHWAPCAVLAINRDTGGVTTLVKEAFDARLTTTTDGAALLLIVDTPAGQLEVRP